MGEVVPARTSPTLHPPIPSHCAEIILFKRRGGCWVFFSSFVYSVCCTSVYIICMVLQDPHVRQIRELKEEILRLRSMLGHKFVSIHNVWTSFNIRGLFNLVQTSDLQSYYTYFVKSLYIVHYGIFTLQRALL